MMMIMMIMMMRAECRRHQTRWVEMQGIVTQFWKEGSEMIRHDQINGQTRQDNTRQHKTAQYCVYRLFMSRVWSKERT
jgi:uncharacterized protein YdaU (DUF1376 family)